MQIEANGSELPVALLGNPVVTTERSHDLKIDKGTIYIVYFNTGSYRKDG